LKQIENVLDVRDVGDRKKVLGPAVGKRPQPRAETTRQYERFQEPVVPLKEIPIMAMPAATTTTPSQRRAVTCSWRKRRENSTTIM